MSDIFDRVTGDQDFFKKILGKIPGFSGYIERQNRRASDYLLRQVIAERYEEQWKRISAIQREMMSQGDIISIDDMEAAAVKIRQFIDRVKNAAYGYASFFDNIKIREDQLTKIYEYDSALLTSVDEVSQGIDNIETSIGTDGLPAAIRNLVTIAGNAVEAFNRRAEVILGQETQQSQ
jgi:hypothetical protein